MMLAMDDGWPIRLWWHEGRTADRGSILIITGRGDFIEKFAETLHDLVDAGWPVAIFDWRGQGLSGRVGATPQHGDSPGFDRWLADLAAVVGWAKAHLPGPLLGLAHSMGGHLLLRHLAGQREDFARAVLVAPMCGVRAQPAGPWIARRLARLMVRLGRGRDFVLGGAAYLQSPAGSPRQRMLTTDAARYADEGWWVAQNPALGIGAVTWRWLDDAFASIAAFRAEAVTTPLLVMINEGDALVDNAATRRVVARLPAGQLAVVAGAGHELLREASDIRAHVLARGLAFLQSGAR